MRVNNNLGAFQLLLHLRLFVRNYYLLLTGNDRFPYSVFMTIENAVKKLRSFYLEQKRLPSYQEMMTLLGFSSKKTSFMWAKKLIAAGFLEKDAQGKLLPKQLFAIPMLGTIRAGHPMMAETQDYQNIDLYHFLLHMPSEVFSLTVRGDSMIEEGIHDGDIVIVQQGKEPRNGDVVAACVDGEWTVKYFKRLEGETYLVPANPRFEIIRPKESLTIGGVVVSVIRKYH